MEGKPFESGTTFNETIEFLIGYGVKDHDNLTQFSDKAAALAFLHRVAAYLRDVSALRTLLAKEGNGINVSQLNDSQMLEVLAERLRYGRIKVRRTPKLGSPSATGIDSEQQYMTPREVEQLEKARRREQQLTSSPTLSTITSVTLEDNIEGDELNLNRKKIKIYEWSDAQLQSAADQIHSVFPEGPARTQNVTTVTVTPKGRIVVTRNGGLPTPAQRAKAQQIFGDKVEFVSGGKTTNATGENGHHAEPRGILNVGSEAQGSRQASSHYSCESCAARQSETGVINITGNASDHGGKITRSLTHLDIELPPPPE